MAEEEKSEDNELISILIKLKTQCNYALTLTQCS